MGEVGAAARQRFLDEEAELLEWIDKCKAEGASSAYYEEGLEGVREELAKVETFQSIQTEADVINGLDILCKEQAEEEGLSEEPT